MAHDKQAAALLDAYIAEVEALHRTNSLPSGNELGIDPAALAAGPAILEAAARTQVAVLRAALDLGIAEGAAWRPWQEAEGLRRYDGWPFMATATLLRRLLKRSQPYTTNDMQAIIAALITVEDAYYFPREALLRALVRPLLADPKMLAACRPDLVRLRDVSIQRSSIGQNVAGGEFDHRRFLLRLDEILGDRRKDALTILSDEWGDQVRPLLDRMDDATRERWQSLLRYGAAAGGGAPSARWLAGARQLVDSLGVETFARHAVAWLGAFRNSSNKPGVWSDDPQRSSRGCWPAEENVALLRGLAWASAGVGDSGLAAALADAAIAGYRKISGGGPRSVTVAAACVYALKSMPGQHGVAQLERVRLSVKQPGYVKNIEKLLDEAARRAGMTREDLEELTVPTFDLDHEGRRRVPVGPATAVLTVAGSDVGLQWYDAAGAPRKAEPAEVKRERKAELKEIKRLRDEMARMLAAHRDRLERLPLAERRWPLAAWRERYLEHALIGGLARRLIWRVADGDRVADGIWLDGRLVDAEDRPLDLGAAATVSAWHPILCGAEAVLAWREWLERHRVTQPFKQAHREVYLLTDAERATRVYSNRFAAHVLRQHQLHALAAARGWGYKLCLAFDGGNDSEAERELPRYGLRAEFRVQPADTGDTPEFASPSYPYVATDQVRFYPLGGRTPRPLDEIPPLVFSEVMRDVDLFVGVSSVGNDPTWQDGGPDRRYRDYWESYSFGALSATAETRKQLLARLVPRLAIAGRCAVEGRFLRVRGDLRTYKIHLGSGNILMEPNDQYLCIVPDRGRGGPAAADELFLPFEGDAVLAIILSKAFLLAADTKIADPTITRQIAVQ